MGSLIGGGDSSSSLEMDVQQESYNFQGNEGPTISGENNRVNVIDGGAFSFAEEIGGKSLLTIEDVMDDVLRTNQSISSDALKVTEYVNRDSLDFAGDINRDSLDFAGDLLDKFLTTNDSSLRTVAEQSKNAMDIAERTTRSDQAVLLDDTIKYITGATVVIFVTVGIAYVVSRRKKQ